MVKKMKRKWKKGDGLNLNHNNDYKDEERNMTKMLQKQYKSEV